jgi:4a-hydroxytetrahydrobiopterin dehydratase
VASLAQMRCVACRRDAPTVTDAEVADLRPQVPDWEIVAPEGIRQLRRIFAFDDFAQALAFTNRVGRLAEEEGHHPLLLTEWGRTTVIRRALDGRFLGDRGAEGYGWSTGRSRLH